MRESHIFEAQIKGLNKQRQINQSEYAELRALIEAQQSQLDSLVKALNTLKMSVTAPTPPLPPSRNESRCFHCDQLGHIARYCSAPPHLRSTQAEKENATPQGN